MNLPFIKNKKEERDYFLTLLFKPHKIGAILFEQINGKLSILDTKEEYIESGIDNLTEKQLIDTCDLVISTVEGVLPEGCDVYKTLFGVPYSWVEETKIKKEYLSELKKICEELELKPIGFIVPIEAVIHYLQEKEGAPVSGVFVEILDKIVIVYVLKASKIIGVNPKKIGESFAKTVESALKEIEGLSILPAKMTLLDYEGVEATQQEFLNYPWTTEIPFLHIPDIEVLKKSWEDEAIINGVAKQMGFEVLTDSKAIHGKMMEEDTIDDLTEKEFPNSDSDTSNQKDINIDENFGFIKDGDILEINQDAESNIEEEEQEEVNISQRLRNNHLPRTSLHNTSKFTSIFSFVNSFTPGHIIGKLRFVNIPKKRKMPSIKLLIIPFVLAGCLVLFSSVYYNSILQTDVVLFMDVKSFNETKNITLSTDGETSVKNGTLKIINISIEEENKTSKQTTGEKETGEKATGEVMVYNKTEQKKMFSKGVIIEGPNKLQFELADEVNIASTSAFSTTMSSAKVKLNAVRFGTEYNLASNTNFAFKDVPTSSYFAKNENAFSGGSKKTLHIVAKKDLDDLATGVVDKLKEKAQTDLSAKMNSGDSLLPFIISNEFVSKSYNKKEGDESATVELTAKVKYTSAFYSKKEIENFEHELTGLNVPENYRIDTAKSKMEIKDISIDKNNKITAKIVINTVYSPEINISSLKTDIVKKNHKDLDSILRRLKGISDFKVMPKNQLPLFPDLLPSNSNNINITTKLNL